MRLVLAQFLRTLKERDEFDRLLPDLLLAMGYVALTKPQTGVRQFGVDLAVTGVSPEDGVSEILLFVIKRGDLGRRDWDNPEPTCVRTSLNEILDAYLPKYVAPEHREIRKRIIVTTTGDMKQDVELNWNGYKDQNASKASFDFWSGDKIAALIETYMLDEHLFAAEDRTDLRKALALAGENEYDYRDLKRLLLRQLGLNQGGTLNDAPPVNLDQLGKALRRVHLASQVCSSWARSDSDTRQALWITERTLLWCWHRVLLVPETERAPLFDVISDLRSSYVSASLDYIEAIAPYLGHRDGMAGYGSEGAELSTILFGHIGILASIGIATSQHWSDDPEAAAVDRENITTIADYLCQLIENNSGSGSPPLDENVVDILLALVFMVAVGRTEEAKNWLFHLAQRLDYSFRSKRDFPVGSDQLADLVALKVDGDGDEEFRDSLMRTSWCLSTFATWCLILGMHEPYALLARGSKLYYSGVGAQLWHPTTEWPGSWYFGNALASGESEAPFEIPEDGQSLIARMRKFCSQPNYDWLAASPAAKAGCWELDFIACRHFRIPVPASFWFQFLSKDTEKN